MKTRAKAGSKAASKASEKSDEPPKLIAPKVQLGPESANPPQLFILPKDLSPEVRIVTLQNPRYSSNGRYLVCPEKGLFEFTKVEAPKTTPRSWLLSHDIKSSVDGLETTKEEDSKEDTGKPSGYIASDATLCIATPIDPLFLVLPALSPKPTSKSSDSPKKLFLSGDDYVERISTISPAFGSLSRQASIRKMLENRMAAVCDTVDAGDETMFRLSEEKLLEDLLKKAKKMTENGLPPSMEEKFVRKALDAPMLSIKRDESSLEEATKEEDAITETESSTPKVSTPDTQTTTSDSAASSFSEMSTSTAATSFSEEEMHTPPIEKLVVIPTIVAPEGVADLLRLRTALFFICSGYLAPHISESLKKLLAAGTKVVDFAPLDAHLAHLAKMRQEAVASRSLTDYSRKRSMFEDDDEEGGRAEKKRKKEEEEKRKKAGESRGVKNLKKVNTTGMKKMSDFFKKA